MVISIMSAEYIRGYEIKFSFMWSARLLQKLCWLPHLPKLCNQEMVR